MPNIKSTYYPPTMQLSNGRKVNHDQPQGNYFKLDIPEGKLKANRNFNKWLLAIIIAIVVTGVLVLYKYKIDGGQFGKY